MEMFDLDVQVEQEAIAEAAAVRTAVGSCAFVCDAV
ncbi:FDLD family class I lanthipeptide [Tumebacillus sp. BK434]|nr:FDLD family class I lanthipeptide [Tumebacillus sp. BK434]